MTPALFEAYQRNPLAADETVRKLFNVPETRYYTVSLWPVPGEVRLNLKFFREAKVKKISKSN